MIKFSDGKSASTYLEVTQLSQYLDIIKDQNDGNVVFGQKGGRKVLPDNASDLSSLIKINVIPKLQQTDYKIYSDNNHTKYYSKTRGMIEDILSKYDLWFVYDMVGEEAPFSLSMNNTFGNSIEGIINGYLQGPLHDLMGMLGQTNTQNKIFQEVSDYFNMGISGGDLYSLLFLSKIKQIKVWQNGDLSFNIPITITFHTLGNEDYSPNQFIQDSIENVVFPTYLLQLMSGYHNQPSLFHINEQSSSWVKTLSKLIRVVIGPMNFKIQIGQFFSTDDYSPLQVSNYTVSYGNFINGYPSTQTQKIQLVNINPIVLEDIPPMGKDQIQPQNSSHTYKMVKGVYRAE